MPILLIGLLFITLSVLNPLRSGPAGILFVLTLVYLFFLSVFSLAIYFGSSLLRQKGVVEGRQAVQPKKAYYIASAVACFPVFLLAIRSIGTVNVIDVLLAAVFVFLASFYIARRT